MAHSLRLQQSEVSGRLCIAHEAVLSGVCLEELEAELTPRWLPLRRFRAGVGSINIDADGAMLNGVPSTGVAAAAPCAPDASDPLSPPYKSSVSSSSPPPPPRPNNANMLSTLHTLKRRCGRAAAHPPTYARTRTLHEEDADGRLSLSTADHSLRRSARLDTVS